MTTLRKRPRFDYRYYDQLRHDQWYQYEKYFEYLQKKLEELNLDAILQSMMAIYEGSPEWRKGYKAGVADATNKIVKMVLEALK